MILRHADFSKVCNAIIFRVKQYKNGLSPGLFDPEDDTNVGNFTYRHSMKSDRSGIYTNTSARTSNLPLCFFHTDETFGAADGNNRY